MLRPDKKYLQETNESVKKEPKEGTLCFWYLITKILVEESNLNDCKPEEGLTQALANIKSLTKAKKEELGTIDYSWQINLERYFFIIYFCE